MLWTKIVGKIKSATLGGCPLYAPQISAIAANPIHHRVHYESPVGRQDTVLWSVGCYGGHLPLQLEHPTL